MEGELGRTRDRGGTCVGVRCIVALVIELIDKN
jgi:hypothetical protein